MAKTTKEQSTPKKSNKKKKPTEELQVLYPAVDVSLRDGVKAPCLTAEEAKSLLGWHEEDDTKKFGADFLLEDFNKKKVRCFHNSNNRPFDKSLSKCWASEILRGHWKLNGETIIIGKYGSVESGQHRLAAVVLADQEYANNPDDYPFWKEKGTAPTLNCLLVFGIEEDDATVNTLDTGKPRSLADVLFRSEYLKKIDKQHRNKASKAAAYAIKFLGHRTGAFKDAFSPKQTHADSLDLLDRHMKLLKCVEHIYTENGDEGRLSKFLSVGYAAALCYMMSCSASSLDKYTKADNPTEKLLTWDLWDDAEKFWTMLAAGAKELQHVREAIASLTADGGTASVNESIAIIVKAWNAITTNGKIKPSDLELVYDTDDDGFKTLAETPTVGGIDIGSPKEEDDPDIAAEVVSEEYEKRQAKKKAKAGEAKAGDHVWVSEDGGHWDGTLESVYGEGNDRVARVTVEDGKTFETPFENVSTVKPE